EWSKLKVFSTECFTLAAKYLSCFIQQFGVMISHLSKVFNQRVIDVVKGVLPHVGGVCMDVVCHIGSQSTHEQPVTIRHIGSIDNEAPQLFIPDGSTPQITGNVVVSGKARVNPVGALSVWYGYWMPIVIKLGVNEDPKVFQHVIGMFCGACSGDRPGFLSGVPGARW